MADTKDLQFTALFEQLDRIEKVLMGAEPQPHGMTPFDQMKRDIDQLKQEIAFLKRLYLCPE